MKLKKILSIISTAAVLTAAACFAVSGEGTGTSVFHVDSVNGTRWADTVVVYKDVASDGQNQWGENLVVSPSGEVSAKIPGGDASGADLAVPEGGMIVTGTGDIGKALYASASVGDRVVFDEYTMNVYISASEPDLTLEKTVAATSVGGVRASGTIIIYEGAGKTGTNVYGYEVGVGSDGSVVFAGGNDSVIPEGGYVLSAIENEDIRTLKTYFPVGARCTRSGLEVTAVYDDACFASAVGIERGNLLIEIDRAYYDELRLIDRDGLTARASALEYKSGDRGGVLREIASIRHALTERVGAGIRAVWYTPVEKNAADVRATDAEIKKAGFNELIIASNDRDGTFVPQDSESPFAQSPAAKRFDVIGAYCEACRAEGLRLTLLVSVMGTKVKPAYNGWLNLNSDGTPGEEAFLSPANAEYRAAFFGHLEYILKHYDINGLQLDYIRYPAYNGGADSGFDEASLALFKQKTGATDTDVSALRKNLASDPGWKRWREFKTGLINEWVEEAYLLAQELRPDVTLSAAVAASGGVPTYCQDPEAWFKGEYIDSIYVMSYVEGVDEEITRRFASLRSEGGSVVMGIGAYISLTPREIVAQTGAASAYGADGVSYFEWTSYRADGYADLLASTAFSAPAVDPVAEPAAAAEAFVASAYERALIWASRSGASASGADVAEAIKTLSEGDVTLPAVKKTISTVGGAPSAITDDLYRAYRALYAQKPGFDRSVYDRTELVEPSSPVEESTPPEYVDSASGYTPKKPASVFSPHFAAAVLIIAIDLFAVSIFIVKRMRRKKALDAAIAEHDELTSHREERAPESKTD